MPSQMLAEIVDIPSVVARQVEEVGPRYREIGDHLRTLNLRAAISNTRGREWSNFRSWRRQTEP